MSEQYVPNLGCEPSDDARRDAVHIAVAPVVVADGEEIWPGDRVKLDDAGLLVSDDSGDDWVGLADPYMDDCVRGGQRCWLLLRPNTITGLRHVWSHPAFKAAVPEAKS